MKLSVFALAAFASAEEEGRKVPPRHPLQRLNRLTQFSEEILSQWFDGLASKDRWVSKFATNAGRGGTLRPSSSAEAKAARAKTESFIF
jgi:hypothetical protein